MADKIKSEVEKARRESRTGGKIAYNSIRWFQNTVKNVIKSPEKAMEEWKYKKGSRIKVGQMVFYQYDAKFKDTLIYWDAYPLAFPISQTSTHFTCLNLHYIPPEYRAFLLDKIYDIWNNGKIPDSKKERLNAEVLNAMRNMAEFKPCVHKYLKSHVKSLFLPVPVEFWDKACMLETAQFQKASRETVYSDSIKKMS